MEIVDIVDASVDESLLYYQAKACERRVIDEFLHEVLSHLASEIVVEISEVYISTKPRPIQFNPLLEVIALLSEETVADMVNTIGKASIHEIVEEHLADRDILNALDKLIAEELEQCVVEVANEGLFAAQCTAMQGVVLASFLKDSRIGLVSIAREALRDEEDEAADFRRQLDRAALKRTLQKSFGQHAVLSHLMMSMASRFDRIMIAHFTKGLMKRVLIQRLVHLMENIEGRVMPVMDDIVRKNNVEAFAFEKIALPPMQDELISQLLSSVLAMEGDIDFVEKAHFASVSSDPSLLPDVDVESTSHLGTDGTATEVMDDDL